ncbi:hypothetical protein [Butyrivibrio sp. FCS014]|uniref:hypothetical protein n=1 Tax=Butyrivibrio sp. FCS014 TaxID=1408304 RepID=UPI000467D1B7|nr:hypothetical protein [Butyrivibrio sp. FCS014]
MLSLQKKVNVDPEEPEGGAAETTYVFDATTLTAAKDKEVIEVGTTFANGYITAYGGVTKRINSSTQKVTSTEIGKSESSYFEFIVTGNANVTIETSSTGGSNTSKVALVRVSGDAKTTVSNNENIEFVTGTSKATLTYYGLGEGTYRFVSPEDTTLNRGARVYKITVVQKGGEAVVQERKAWGEVAAPVIDKISLSEDGKTINVKFTVETGYDGADSVTAVMYDAKTDEKVMNASKVDNGTATFTPSASGEYYFVVAAHRIDEEDKNSDKSENLKFVLPLAAPGNQSCNKLKAQERLFLSFTP